MANQKPKIIFDGLSLVGIICVVIVVAGVIVGIIHSSTTPSDISQAEQVDTQVTDTPSVAISTTPEPTTDWVTKANEDKARMENVTLADLAKQPNFYKTKPVAFTAKVSEFIQDSKGNTTGMNVSDNGIVAYIELDPDMSLKQINKGDSITIWGTVLGIKSGPNAFGVTVQETDIVETYLTDNTTGYVYDGIVSPTPKK